MAHITKRTTKAGEPRYDVEWRSPDGKPRCKTFTRRKDADAHRTKVEHDRLTGFDVDPAGGRLTVANLSERWLGSNPGKRESTIGRDLAALRAHILPAIGTYQLRAIRQADVQQLVNQWSTSLAPKTVQRTYGTLRAAMAYAVNADLIARSPCRNIRLPQHNPPDRLVLTPADVGTLAEAIDPRYRAMVWVATLLGLRWGEVAGLRVGRLDLLARSLSVAEIVTRDRYGRPITGPPKSAAGVRTLAMPESLVDLLAEHMAAAGLTAADSSAYVFPAPSGAPWSYANFRRRVWVPATVEAGLPGVGFHDLRRVNATAMVADGVDLKTAQTRLGHSDPRLTLAVYAQAVADADRAAAESIGRRFAGAMGDGSRDSRGMNRSPTRTA